MLTDIIKEKIKERYGKIALSGNTDSCCMPEDSEDDDNRLFVDVDSIKFNKGKNDIYQHGKIKDTSLMVYQKNQTI